MFVHLFLFRWKTTAADADKSRAVAAVRAFVDVIPGLHDVRVGLNVSAKARGYGLGGAMQFEDRAAYDAYCVHPAHVELLEWLVPLIDAVEVDFTD